MLRDARDSALRSFLIRAAFLVPFATGCSGDVTNVDSSEDAVTAVPETAVRDQKDTGNCWLFATTGWIESLEYGARVDAAGAGNGDAGDAGDAASVTAPPHWSVSYLDYWDWYAKITSSGITGRKTQTIRDQLDSGGSWGAAVEIVAQRGLVRARDWSGAEEDADLVDGALVAMTTSLLSGPLRTAAARRNRALVRSELDAAFGVKTKVRNALEASFGDGSRSFAAGDATAGGVVVAPYDLDVRLPKIDGTTAIRKLSDAIGERAGGDGGDDPDVRVGEWAWTVARYTDRSPSETRAYFQRIQRALHAHVPVPIAWFVASNGDPDEDGTYLSVSRTSDPAIDAWSGPHETLLDDYEIDDVPGFGRLAAGEPASSDAEEAALADSAQMVFLRVKNSWGGRANPRGPAGYDDLYVDYLTGTQRVCPEGARATSSKCWNEVPLEEVALPAGF